MEIIIHYFENIPSVHRSLILVGGISFFLLLEGFFPLIRKKKKKWKHAIPNIFFTTTTILINFSMAFLLLKTSDWVILNEFGILNWLPEMSLSIKVLLGVLTYKKM